MKYQKLRIAVNAVKVMLILLSRLIIRKRRKIVYFNANTGVSAYKTTYYIFMYIPILSFERKMPN